MCSGEQSWCTNNRDKQVVVGFYCCVVYFTAQFGRWKSDGGFWMESLIRMFWNRAAVITSRECGVEAQTDMLHPLISQTGWTSYVPLCLQAVLLYIWGKVCGNPARSLHCPCDNYELLQARVFVSNSLILRIIIDHRCLAKSVFEVFSLLSFFPSSSLLWQWTEVICPASPHWRASPFS